MEKQQQKQEKWTKKKIVILIIVAILISIISFSFGRKSAKKEKLENSDIQLDRK